MILGSKASAPLCRACESIFADFSYEWWEDLGNREIQTQTKITRTHHPSEKSFLQAVDDGCWLCNKLAKIRRDREKCGTFDDDYITFDDKNKYRLKWRDEYGWFVFGFPSMSNHLIFIREVDYRSSCNRIAATSKSHSWTGCEDITRLAAYWLGECNTKHKCLPSFQAQWYPTRLLDISTDDVRLVVADRELGLGGPYATLSHCWGKRQFLVLTSENMPEFLRGISVHRLPRSFREVIETVRKLRIRYLWIDCYCIIQGSDEAARVDWDREAGRMEEVYSYSFLNIGSAHSASPYDGLYHDRDLLNSHSLFMKWKPTAKWQASEFMMWIRLGSEPLEGAFDDLSESSITTRAWAIQEAVLSSRMLSYTDKQVFWQCAENAACEDFPQEEAEQVNWAAAQHPFWTSVDSAQLLRSNRRTPPGGFLLNDNSYDFDGKNYRASPEEKWFNALTMYCTALLTYHDKDVFRAIDGVGRRFGRLTGRSYRHGILDGTLPRALLWVADSNSCRRASTNLAPSWHWASYETLDFSSFGSITSLYFKERVSRGRFAPLAYVFMSDDCEQFARKADATDLWPYLFCIGRPLEVNFANRDGAGSSRSPSNQFLIRGASKNSASPCIDKDGNDEFWLYKGHNVNSQYLYLPLIVRERLSGYSNGFIRTQGLLLRATRCRRYRRIGYCDAGLLDEEFWQQILVRGPKLIILE